MNAFSQGKSGGDMVFIEIAKRIKNYDKVTVTSLLGKNLCQECGLEGKFLITTRELEFRNVIFTYIRRILKTFFLKLEIKKGDIFWATSDFLPDILPIFLLKKKNSQLKWIQHIFHLISSERKLPFRFQKISFFMIRKLADVVVVDNSQLRDDLVNLGFSKEKIFVNYPGINFEYLRTFKAKRGFSYDGIFMAQFRESKGIFDLLKIWKLVCQINPEMKLGIIGKGERRITEEFRNKLESAGLKENVDLLGFLSDSEAFALIKASKVFVFPSHEEGFGIAALEAQALGLPVVAWNLPVFDEVFPKGMIKVETGEAEEFAEKIAKLLKDKQLYRKSSAEAVNNAGQYDWDKSAERELRLIESMTK